jgi:Tfp pilus assembly protein PilF
VQLTNATNGILLWSKAYEREVKDVFVVQDDLSRDIVSALKITLTGGGSAAASVSALKGTADLEAYDLFLRGLHFLQLRGGGVARSVEYFQQAIARDSSFARAWAQLGTSYAVMPLFAFVRPDSVEPLARAAITQALALDPTSAEAYAASGISFTMMSDASQAIVDFERAIALDSSYGFAHRGYTAALMSVGRNDEAVAESRRSMRSDPLSAPALAAAGIVMLIARHETEALSIATRAVELDSVAPWPRVVLAYALFTVGRVEEARAMTSSIGRLTQGASLKGYLLGATGNREAAVAFLRELEGDRGHMGFFHLAQAWTYLGLRDTTQALSALEQAARAREPIGFAAAFGMHAYDPIRQSPRFADIVRTYGVDPASVGVTSPRR